MSVFVRVNPAAQWLGVLNHGDNIPLTFTDDNGVGWTIIVGGSGQRPTFGIDANGVPYIHIYYGCDIKTTSNIALSGTNKLTVLVGIKIVANALGAYMWLTTQNEAGSLTNYFQLINQQSGYVGGFIDGNVEGFDADGDVYRSTPRQFTALLDRTLSGNARVNIRRDKADVSETTLYGTSGTTSGNFQDAQIRLSGQQSGAGYTQTDYHLYFLEIHDAVLSGATSPTLSSRESAIYNQVNPPPPDTTPPTDVVLGSTLALGQTSARFNFTPATDANGILKYRWQFDTVNTFNSPNLIDEFYNGTTSPYDKLSGLSVGEQWYARAKAVDNSSNQNQSTNWSNIVSVTTWNAAPSFTTAANLGNVDINTPTDFAIGTTGGDGTRTVTAPEGLLAGASYAGGVLTINRGSTGAFSQKLRVTDDNGQYTERTFLATLIDPNAAPTIVPFLWSKRQIVPVPDMLFWHALDEAEDATDIQDYSGNKRNLIVESSAPVLQSDVINGLPGVYFDGTKNPLNFTEDITLKHLFLITAFDGATFTGNEGLISGVGTNSILLGNGAGTNKFANLAFGDFVYRKSDVELAESNELSPMVNFEILELVFPTGYALDGIQIGQDITNVGRKWKGWWIEQIGYGAVKNWFERMRVYHYFACKFHLWRELSDGTKIFPFPNNHQSPFTPLRYKIQSPPLPNGKIKTRVKGSKLQAFDFNYGVRAQYEADAIDAFETDYFDGRVIAVENNSFYPPRRFNIIPTTDISVEPNGINLFGYKWSGRQSDTSMTKIDVNG